jgi:hypothetical protein
MTAGDQRLEDDRDVFSHQAQEHRPDEAEQLIDLDHLRL